MDGWLHSGDLARIDDEGLVYVVDRIKDMINRGGENVYCVEVENALAGAPGVFEAAVLGVPDEMMGEKVGAVIVPMPGGTLDVPAVLGYLGEHIADFKVPQYVAVARRRCRATPAASCSSASSGKKPTGPPPRAADRWLPRNRSVTFCDIAWGGSVRAVACWGTFAVLTIMTSTGQPGAEAAPPAPSA